MFVSLTQVCVVYVIKEVTSFPGGLVKLYRPAVRKLCSLRRNWN